MQKQTQNPGNINRSQSQHNSLPSQPTANDSNKKKIAIPNEGPNSTARITDQAIDVLSFMGFKL